MTFGPLPILNLGAEMLTRNSHLVERNRVLRVLLIDASVAGAKRVRTILQREGEFLIDAARDPGEALELLRGGVYDVALVDYGLWANRDSEFVHCVRENHSDLAVVLLTSGENEREALPALKLGAHDFVSRHHMGDGQLSARIAAAYEESRALRRRETMVRWLEREARTDHLTGLYNRRAFDERLREACEAASAKGDPVTLIVVDITGTRTVNESHGHEIGDRMIRRAASGISRSIRGADFAARIGGDDFGIILADGDIDLGRLIARRIAQEVERLNAADWEYEIPVSLTLGVASGRNCQPGELFAAAEQQLSDNKSARAVITILRSREDPHGPDVA